MAQTKIAADGTPTVSVVAAMPSPRTADEGEDRAADRQASSLPGGARLAERRESDEAADQRVERAGEAVEQLAADVSRQRRVGAVVRGRRASDRRCCARAGA